MLALCRTGPRHRPARKTGREKIHSTSMLPLLGHFKSITFSFLRVKGRRRHKTLQRLRWRVVAAFKPHLSSELRLSPASRQTLAVSTSASAMMPPIRRNHRYDQARCYRQLITNPSDGCRRGKITFRDSADHPLYRDIRTCDRYCNKKRGAKR